MPYYRITILVAFEGEKSGIKFHHTQDGDIVYDLYYSKARQYYGPKMLKFECVHLSERSRGLSSLKNISSIEKKTVVNAGENPDTVSHERWHRNNYNQLHLHTWHEVII
jgi:hypothetical protein